MPRFKSSLLTAALALGLAHAALAHAALASTTHTAPSPAPRAPDETAAIYKRIADQVGPALVTVKFILKFEGGGQFADMMGGDDGRETEMTGLMIEPGGLVLCSNFRMGGMAAIMGGGNANPTDIKILPGDETEGLKAKVLARDTDLDLCWVQIDDEKAKGKTFSHVDLKSSSTVTLGERLIAVQRKGKFFDHAMVVAEGRVGGLARKPRALVIPSGIAAELGMPIFNAEGKVIGIGVLQLPSREDMEGGDMGGMFEGFGGGGPVILPADDVAKATERGKAMPQKEPEAKAETTPEEKK